MTLCRVNVEVPMNERSAVVVAARNLEIPQRIRQVETPWATPLLRSRWLVRYAEGVFGVPVSPPSAPNDE